MSGPFLDLLRDAIKDHPFQIARYFGETDDDGTVTFEHGLEDAPGQIILVEGFLAEGPSHLRPMSVGCIDHSTILLMPPEPTGYAHLPCRMTVLFAPNLPQRYSGDYPKLIVDNTDERQELVRNADEEKAVRERWTTTPPPSRMRPAGDIAPPPVHSLSNPETAEERSRRMFGTGKR